MEGSSLNQEWRLRRAVVHFLQEASTYEGDMFQAPWQGGCPK